MLAGHGIWAIVAAISPYRAARAEVRGMLADRGLAFLEIYVRCPLAVAERRDPKQLYLRARRGEIPCFTGVSAPYEEPLTAELVVDTSMMSPEECARAILSL
jgi:adenylylsulfate kinase